MRISALPMQIIDKAEREVSQKLNILLVIHMDPIETHDKRVLAVRSQVDAGGPFR